MLGSLELDVGVLGGEPPVNSSLAKLADSTSASELPECEEVVLIVRRFFSGVGAGARATAVAPGPGNKLAWSISTSTKPRASARR